MTSPPLALKSLTVVRQGDRQGNGMILEITTASRTPLWAIGIPQPYPTTTGPTWVYVVGAEGLTLIDAGGRDSREVLETGLAQIGMALGNVERVVITHGHQDHDGGVGEVAQESSAEVWAHELYPHVMSEGSWHAYGGGNPLIKRLLPLDSSHAEPFHGHGQEPPHWWHYHLEYIEMRRNLKVARPLKNGDSWGGLSFLHTPGHSPDEMCITMEGVVFTGDHVLPEITPHPTVKSQYPDSVHPEIPQQYPSEEQYGLLVYLKSLKTIANLEPSLLVLPAHRLYNRGKLHLLTVQRASDIARHHVRRLRRLTRKLQGEALTLEELTRAVFPPRKLAGGNFMSGVTEVVSHLELLLETGDVSITPEGRLRWHGTEGFRQLVASLGL